MSKQLNWMKKYSYSSSIDQFAGSRQTQSSSPKDKPVTTLAVNYFNLKDQKPLTTSLKTITALEYGSKLSNLKVVTGLIWLRALSSANKTEEPSLYRTIEYGFGVISQPLCG